MDLLRLRYGIKDVKLLKRSGIILGGVILAFFAHSAFHHPLLTVATIALGGAVLMLLVTSPHHVEEQLEAVEWTTIIFFSGLFIMIGGLQYMGLIDSIADGISNTISRASPENRLMVAVLLLLWVSGVASAFIDNIPYTATMVPVVIELASDPSLGLSLGPLAWALALGACLGGMAQLSEPLRMLLLQDLQRSLAMISRSIGSSRSVSNHDPYITHPNSLRCGQIRYRLEDTLLPTGA